METKKGGDFSIGETGSSDALDLPVNELAELTVVAEGEERPTFFVWLLVLCCGISGLLFGQPSLRHCIPLLVSS